MVSGVPMALVGLSVRSGIWSLIAMNSFHELLRPGWTLPSK